MRLRQEDETMTMTDLQRDVRYFETHEAAHDEAERLNEKHPAFKFVPQADGKRARICIFEIESQGFAGYLGEED